MNASLSPAATAAADLRAARALIEDPAHWTRRALARRRLRGPAVSVLHPKAVCFCMTGAICHVVRGASDARETACVRFLYRAVGSELTSWNDRRGRTHPEVLAAIDRAIALAEEDARCE